MIFSKFVLVAKSEKEVFLKQLLTGSVISVSESDKELLMDNDFSTLDDGTIQEMEKMGFIVGANEDDQFLNLFRKEWSANQNFMDLFIIPTANCQLKCPYCYEDGIDRSGRMTNEMQAKVVEWLKSYLEKNPAIEELDVIFHGGEPLLHKKAIRWLLPKIQEVCTFRGVTMKTQIVSNGVLLDMDIVRFLGKYNLQRMQLTLDGLAEVHDKRRPFRNGQGTYDIIISNIRNILDSKVIERVNLRVNIDADNIESIPAFIRFLADDPLFLNGLKLSLGVITPTVGCNGRESHAEKYTEDMRLKHLEDAREYAKLSGLAKSLGFEMPTEYIAGPWCAARHPYSWAVGPKGEVYKCASDFGRPERVFGSIEGRIDASQLQSLSENRIKECLEKGCSLVPICGGGCLFNLRISPGISCPETFLEEVNRQMILHR